ncbi:MAG: tRNA-dihydrouridine synthase [Planctomycetes bacterium]|nr:tRNA-dihydrouridine synthase [Planctomycetota bacterium]
MAQAENLVHPVQIGRVALAGNLALAPMHRRTGLAFRLMARRFGAALTHTEMATPEELLCWERHRGGNRRKGGNLLASSPEDRPLGVQILPHRGAPLVEAVAMVAERGAGDLVDLNFACPSKRVAGEGCGAVYLRDPEPAVRFVETAARAGPLPVTIKVRYGYTDSEEDRHLALELARGAVAAGAAAVTLHARTAADRYDRRAHWPVIAEWADALPVPVFGCGDLVTPEAVVEMLRQTRCAGASIARGAAGAPWIFRQARELAETGSWRPLTMAERGGVFLDHYAALLQQYGEDDALRYMQHVGSMYARDMPGAQAAIHKARSADALRQIAAEWFR